MALTPKLRTPQNGPAPKVVNESDKCGSVDVTELQRAAKATFDENQKLRVELQQLRANASQTMNEAIGDAGEWKRRALAAEDRLEKFEDGEFKDLRESRKFNILASLLQGAAAAGQIYGNGVKEGDLNRAIIHYTGVAEIAEKAAFKRGF